MEFGEIIYNIIQVYIIINKYMHDKTKLIYFNFENKRKKLLYNNIYKILLINKYIKLKVILMMIEN